MLSFAAKRIGYNCPAELALEGIGDKIVGMMFLGFYSFCYRSISCVVFVLIEKVF